MSSEEWDGVSERSPQKLTPEQRAEAEKNLTRLRKLEAELAPTGPLTPGQVTCRVCQLDDRTRAASSPDDKLCDVCRDDTPNRVARRRREKLQAAVEVFLGIEPNTETGALADSSVSMELELRQERADVLVKLADLVAGHSYPEALLQGIAPLGAVPVPVSTLGDLVPQVTTTTLREEAAEALAELEKHAVDPETDAEPATRSTTPSDSWGLPDNPKQGDCTLFGTFVLGYDEKTCTCPAGGDDQFGHTDYCGWAPFAKPVEWLKKLAPDVKFVLGQTTNTEFLNTWDGQLFDVPNDKVARKDLLEANDNGHEFAVYALVRIPAEVVSRDDV